MPHGPGWCTTCRVVEAVDGHSRCAPCAAAARKYEAARRAERRKKSRCLTCGAAVAKGRRYCKAHLAYYLARYHASK